MQHECAPPLRSPPARRWARDPAPPVRPRSRRGAREAALPPRLGRRPSPGPAACTAAWDKERRWKLRTLQGGSMCVCVCGSADSVPFSRHPPRGGEVMEKRRSSPLRALCTSCTWVRSLTCKTGAGERARSRRRPPVIRRRVSGSIGRCLLPFGSSSTKCARVLHRSAGDGRPSCVTQH